MGLRNIIEIDEALCDGCGLCVPSCAEGALQIVDGKARLVAAVLCDGLGVCLGQCPTGALTVIQRDAPESATGSKLRQWPVQLHLVPPTAPFFQDRDVLLAADCVPVAVADFHRAFLDGRGLAIACPKLDQHLEIYVEKLAAMIDEAHIRSLTVAIMEVPCCGGLVRMAMQAQAAVTRKVPIRLVKIGIRGDILSDETV